MVCSSNGWHTTTGTRSMGRNDHTAKSRSERQYYAKQIHRQDYDPTSDDSLDFPDSDDPSEELAVSPTNRLQTVNPISKVSLYIRDHWVEFLVAAVALVLGFFLFEFNRDMGRVEGSLQGLSTENERQESIVEMIRSQNSQTQSSLQSIDVRFQFLQRDIERILERMGE